MQPNEKNILGQIFDRETKRERNLEQIKKLAGMSKGKGEGGQSRGSITVNATEAQAREKAFFEDVKMSDAMGTAVARGAAS